MQELLSKYQQMSISPGAGSAGGTGGGASAGAAVGGAGQSAGGGPPVGAVPSASPAMKPPVLAPKPSLAPPQVPPPQPPAPPPAQWSTVWALSSHFAFKMYLESYICLITWERLFDYLVFKFSCFFSLSAFSSCLLFYPLLITCSRLYLLVLYPQFLELVLNYTNSCKCVEQSSIWAFRGSVFLDAPYSLRRIHTRICSYRFSSTVFYIIIIATYD